MTARRETSPDPSRAPGGGGAATAARAADKPGSPGTLRTSGGRLAGVRRQMLDLERGWVITITFFVLLALTALSDPGSIPTLTDGLVLLTMCYAWNFVGGSLGEMSFAHMIFWGIGGYGLVFVINDSQPILPWLVALALMGAVAGAAVAGLISAAGIKGLLPISIFTLVVGQIAFSFATGNERLGAVEGLVVNALPPYSIEVLFLFLLGIAGLSAAVNLAVTNGRFGRELLAIRDDRVAATVAGVNVERQRYLAYMLSAALFVLGGAYQAYYGGYARPDLTLAIAPLILVTLSIFVGGPGTAMGPLIGAFIIYGLQAATQQASSSADASLYAQLVAYGVALLLLRLLFPRLKGVDLATSIVRGLSRLFNRGVRKEEVRKEEGAAVPVSTSETVDAILTEGESRADTPAPAPHDGLQIVDVRKSFGRLDVLRGISFSVRPGEVVGILGPNGAGKSTLCNLISGVEPPSGGAITLDGTDITGVPVHRKASHGMGRSFQTPRLFASLSLAENLTLARHHLSELTAEELLGRLGIQNARHRRGDDSQFFARRLTEVTKATMQGSSVLMLDEPLAGLTGSEHDIVLGMARHAANAGACVVIVEHLIPVLAPAVDRMVVLHDGRIIADGPPTTVLQQHEVIEAYLGTPHTEDGQ
jgi:branched-chain amino acid transport system permease protein